MKTTQQDNLRNLAAAKQILIAEFGYEPSEIFLSEDSQNSTLRTTQVLVYSTAKNGLLKPQIGRLAICGGKLKLGCVHDEGRKISSKINSKPHGWVVAD